MSTSQYLTQLASEGRVLIFGRTANNDATTFGIAILQVESTEDARQIMTHDPVVTGGVMHAELYPYRIPGMADISAFPVQ